MYVYDERGLIDCWGRVGEGWECVGMEWLYEGAGGWICGGLGCISLLFSGFRGVVLGRVSAILSRRVR